MRVATASSFRLAILRVLISVSPIAIGVSAATAADEAPEAPTIPAFPGAEGFGWHAIGGRGGSVYEVTNLNDAGPGSLRDAVSQPHRTIVFRVSGTIDLQSQLVIREPFVTIAGQTAPGDGICLRNYSFELQSHDLVVRYLRSRLGDEARQEDDSISILHGCRDVIVDHCSATWSIDEDLSTSGNDDRITVQWCLIAEPLNHSVHKKGNHGYGSLARANGSVSWLHNLWAHCDSRSPRLGDNYNRGPHPTFDVRNNVIYDYGEICSGLTQGVLSVNYVGNYIRPGPSSKARTPIHVGGPSTLRYFIRDNVFEGNDELTADNSQFFDPVEIDGKRQVETVDEAFAAPPMTTVSAAEAFEKVLAEVGATLPKRDSVDARIIDTVRNRTGKIIDSQREVGGWPELKSTEAPIDSDHDGMPDDWEIAHGLNPHDPSDAAADSDHDGYTNLEEYLNATDPNKFIDYRDAKNNVSSLKPR
jgi:pectate lyase